MPDITGDKMVSVDTRMTQEMVDELERRVNSGAYSSRSEAIRDAVREKFDLVKRTSTQVRQQ